MPDKPRTFEVTVIRTVEILATNAFEAGERGLDLMQRQKAWPGTLKVTVNECAGNGYSVKLDGDSE